MYDIIIQNGTIIDGTGKPMYTGDIGIREGMIRSIGFLRGEAARQVIDAAGCFVSPGFIDITNHSDTYWQIFAQDGMESLLRQGITSVIGGSSGSSLAPFVSSDMLQTIQKWVDIRGLNLNWLSMEDFLLEIEHRHLPVNFGTFVGHATLRRGLLHDIDRPLAPEELSVMQKMLKQAIQEGALGVSFGLAYSHARDATRPELAALMDTVKHAGGLVSIHLRNEDGGIIESLEESILLAQSSGARTHIAHLKVVGESHWPLMEQALYLIDTAKSSGADISFDLYPYTSTASVLYTFLPEWLTRGGKKFFMERLKNAELRQKAVLELQEKHFDYTKATLLLSTLNTVTTRQNIAEMAEAQHTSPEEILLDLLVAGNGRAIVSWDTISEENIAREMAHPLSMVSSNGVGYAREHQKTGESIHPRNFGAMPRFLGTYVREKHLLEWEAAIHKITGAPAARLGLADRGIIREDVPADIVVFEPDTIEGAATFDQPYRVPRGIRTVIVSGEAAFIDHHLTGARTGQVLRHRHSWLSW